MGLACSVSIAAQSYSDSFEGATLNTFWTVRQQFGSVALATSQSLSGSQSAQFSSTNGGQREMHLTHTFPALMKGRFTVYFYDAAPGQETLYESLNLNNSTQPNMSAGIGTQDFDAYCYKANITDAAGTTRGPNGACGIYPQVSTTNVTRTLGWHRLEINVAANSVALAIDGQQVFTTSGDYSFDTVDLAVSGPVWRPNTTAYFDDFNFTGQAVSLTSISVSPATPTIALGQTQRFTATGTFSDGSTRVLGSNPWVSLASMPTRRRLLAAAEQYGLIYTFGGCGSNCGGAEETKTEAYNPATNSWSTKAVMPTTLVSAAAAAPGNGMLYTFGGLRSGNTVQEYNPATDTWALKAPMSTGRYGLAAVALNGKVYAIGGMTTGGTTVPTTALNGKVYAAGLNGPSNAVEEYDPATNTWATKAAMPTARLLLSAVVLNGKIYAIGGSPDSSGNSQTNVVEEYDPATNTWTAKAPLPAALQVSAAAAVNGRLYVFGGFFVCCANVNTVYEYNPSNNSWTTKNPMPTARDEAPAILVDGKVYVIGGADAARNALGANEVFDPLAVIWSSGNTSVATIDQTALATSVSSGITTITAASGNISGNTSLTIIPPTYSVSGRVTDAANHGLGGVAIAFSGSQTQVALTDASGNYLVLGLAAGNYIITPSKLNYTFSPASVSGSLSANVSNLNFTAQPIVAPTPTPLPSPSPGSLLTQPLGTLNPQITAVALPGGQFTISRPANAAGFNGFVTDRPFDFTGGRVSVGVAQAASGGADTTFAIGTDNTNFFRFVIRSQASAGGSAQENDAGTMLDTTTAQLIFQVRQDNGELRSYPIPPINYDPALHRFLRFRHDRSTSYPGQPDSALGYIVFDASGCPASGSCPPSDPDSLPWRELFRIPLMRTVAAMEAELSSGTTTPAVPPGTAIFDNFRPFNPNTPTQPPLGNYALLLNGTNAYFEVSTISGLNITGPLTVETWFKTNLANRQQSLVERYNTDAANQNLSDGGYVLRIGPTGKLQFYTLKNGLVFDMVEGGRTVTLGQWHHAAGVFDGSQLRVYLDGAQDGLKSSTFFPAAGAASLKIGAQGDTAINRLNGAITEVRISTGALFTGSFTPSQLLAAGLGTAGLWRFDAQSLSDFSGNGNTGVLRGDATFANVVPPVTYSPVPITYGTALSQAQLNATSSVPGTYSSVPAFGTVLPAGAHTLLVTFTPNDTASFNNVTTSVTINVLKATPSLSVTGGTYTYDGQPHPATGSVTGVNGQSLGALTITYNGSSNVPVNASTYSAVGSYAGDDNYNLASSAAATVIINKATPVLTWNNPADIRQGTPLSGAQLNATASVPGMFTYSPAEGAVLNVGTGQALSVAFTPNDTANYNSATKSVTINVLPAIPQPPTIRFSQTDYQVVEGIGRVTLTVTRTGDPAGIVTVDYRTTDTDTFIVNCADTHGAAFGRCDFATAVGTLTFAAGDQQSKTITVPVIDDVYIEGNEFFQVKLSNPVGATLGAPDTATVTITDDDTNPNAPNPVYSATNPNGPSHFFVRQQYLDFLSREPETAGLNAWLNVLNQCVDVNNVDSNSPSAGCDRITVSAAFFGSQEFQLKGSFVFRFYRVAFGRLPEYSEIVADMSAVTGQTAAEVFQRKAQFTNAFAQRQRFRDIYDGKTNDEYVAALLGPYNLTQITTPNPATPDDTINKVTLTDSNLVNQLKGSTLTRAQVLRAVADSDQVGAAEINNAFVAIEYYGYLRRTPDQDGFNAWLRVVQRGDTRAMVNGFMNSREYRLRFGNPDR